MLSGVLCFLLLGFLTVPVWLTKTSDPCLFTTDRSSRRRLSLTSLLLSAVLPISSHSFCSQMFCWHLWWDCFALFYHFCLWIFNLFVHVKFVHSMSWFRFVLVTLHNVKYCVKRLLYVKCSVDIFMGLFCPFYNLFLWILVYLLM